MSASRKRHVVWQFFEKVSESVVSCKLCEANEEIEKGRLKFHGSPTNMVNHLKAHHKDIHDEVIGAAKQKRSLESDSESSQSSSISVKQPKIASYLTTFRPLSNSDVQRINQQLIFMICSDLQPFSLVEDKGFIEFCKALNPNYKIPSRKTVQKLLSSSFCKVKSSLEDLLQRAEFIAITTDIWKSSKNRSYLTVTAHFIIDNQLYDCSLETVPITVDETAEQLFELLNGIFCSWNIREKIVIAVTDNAANMIATCQKLKIKRIPCMGHLLNLCAGDVIKHPTFKPIFKKCKQIVTEFRKSGPAKLEIDSIQFELDPELKNPLTFISYCKTRWNSRLAMICRILQLKPCLLRYWEINTDSVKLSESQFNTLNDFKFILSPLAEATNSLSGRKYITISTVIPIINLTIDAVSNTNPTTSSGRLMKQSLSSALENRFKSEYYTGRVSFRVEEDNFLQTATYLDGRFRAAFFELNDNVDQVRDYVHTKLSTNANSRTLTTLIEPANDQISSIWTNSKFTNKSKVSSDINALLVHYESSPLWPSTNDPLLNCPSFSQYFTELSRLKCKFLCAPATSVPSESFFSSLEYITSDRRNQISDENLNIVSFLHANLNIYKSQLEKDGKQLSLIT